MSIGERLDAVRSQIEATLASAGRAPGSVRLIAVSKTKPAADIRAAYGAGQRDFGENYVQEMLAKASELADLHELRFHLIGHLQRNKVKSALRAASAVHTVDSVHLAEELAKRAAEAPFTRPPMWPEESPGASPRLAVLVEVNVGGEAQKSGCEPAELGAVLDAVARAPVLRLAGLMTVPPFTDDPAASRPFFDALARLRDEHGGQRRLPELSMGMSHDVEHAIRAGATMVRMGRAIFGERG